MTLFKVTVIVLSMQGTDIKTSNIPFTDLKACTEKAIKIIESRIKRYPNQYTEIECEEIN